ncbi:hypothetical protein HU200_018752 [Digitaria exilis]|uniref:Uncharacterized protein n=1 Tax=Digitaria exilis TaxID=1010633 RepID=A0A835F4E2_9POAL|nr:hypothetical protein HU200_018752 [Digitaria exilis]
MLSISWDFSLPETDTVIKARRCFGSEILREIMIVSCWTILTHRNIIFFLW